MENKIDCLNHGFVRLVDHMGSDLSIVRAARVSYDAAWRAGEDQGSDARLINYLWKNHHTTPFEAVTLTFEVKAPIFVYRQWHRHRTQSYNELSARYKELPNEFYLPKPEHIGAQSASSKQAREMSKLSDKEIADREEEILALKQNHLESYALYEHLLNKGWPKEIARSCLGVGYFSHMFCTMNLLNLFKFLNLRCHKHAQYEIRVYAQAMAELIEPIVPVAHAAWRKSYEENKDHE